MRSISSFLPRPALPFLKRPMLFTTANPDTRFKIIECPRDAIQGLRQFIPTGEKQRYINCLLRCGFDTIDFGSFVGPNAIPQMRDTGEVLKGLDLSTTNSKLLAIVANIRGAQEACQYPEISCLGFPLSVNETFQQRNTRKSIAEAMDNVKRIQELCKKHNKTLVVYLSMAFGNPYGEAYREVDIEAFVDRLDREVSVEVISLADTIGCSTPLLITKLFQQLIPAYPHIEIGAHFHSSPALALEKVKAAYESGVRRIDGALGGMGGCPYAAQAMIGNVATETVTSYLASLGIDHGIHAGTMAHAEDIRALLFHAPVRELMLAVALGNMDQFRRMCRTHFDEADTDKSASLDFPQFQTVMLDVYRELGEEAPAHEKLEQMFLKHAKDSKIYFEEYLQGSLQGLQKRLESIQQAAPK